MKNKKSKYLLKYLLLTIILIFTLISSIFIYSVYIYDTTPSSYIPQIDFSAQQVNQNNKSKFFATSKIELTDTGSLFLVNKNQERILQFALYTEFEADGSKNIEVINTFSTGSFSNDSLTIVPKIGSQFLETSIYLNSFSSGLLVNTYFKANTEIKVERISIVLLPRNNPSALVRKNNQIDDELNHGEYWLGNNRIIELPAETGEILLIAENVSSVQYKNDNNQIWINADYSIDHPFLKVKKNGGGELIDLSRNRYSEGDSIAVQFSFYFGKELKTYPRLSNHQNGFQSTIVWTEHADNTILETHKAVYYGSSKINKPDDAVGGFVKHNIPVTKGVFFSNIDSSTNTPFNDQNNQLQSSIITEPEFLNFLNDLYKTGNYEIALHTLDPWDDIALNISELLIENKALNNFNHIALQSNSVFGNAAIKPFNKLDSTGTNQKQHIIDLAFRFMKENFNTVTWIDHGMSDGFGNRESFVAEGLDANSEHFMADLWKEYGIKYFWNSSIEKMYDCSGLKQKLLNLELVEFIHCYFDRIIGSRDYLHSGEGEHIPTPVYWQNNFHNESFYSWGTLRASGHHPGWIWNYKYSESQLDQLVQERGVNIIHTYPAFVGRTAGYFNGMWEKENGHYFVNPDFDEVLHRMAFYRDEGLINLSTIRDYLNFKIGLKNVEITHLAGNEYEVNNKNDFELKGVTLVVDKEYSITTDIPHTSKIYESDFLCWFDLAPFQTVTLSVLPGRE